MAETLNYNINVGGNASESVGSLKKQLREAQAEVGALSDKFGATSKEAINAAKRAAELKDRIGDAKALTDAFNPDQKFSALSKSLVGVAGGFSAVQGAIGLFGTESKELEKQLLKVQSALAFSQGLEQLGNAKDSFVQLGGVIKDRVVTAFSTLKGAIIATGIGALVVALGLVIANFDKIKKVVLNLFPALGGIADFIGNLVNKVTDFIGVTSEAGRATAKLIADNDKALKDSERNLELNGDKYDEYTKRKIEANNEFKKKQNEFLKDEQLTEGERNRFILEAREKAGREILKADKDRQDNADAENKKQREKNKAQADKDAAEEIARREAKDQRESVAQQIQIDAFRSTLEKRQQDILAAEDDFEKKKGELIKAGVTDFTFVEEQYRLKLLEINKTYNEQEEKAAEEKNEKQKEKDLVNKERLLQIQELNADSLEEQKNAELASLESEYQIKYDFAVKNGEDLLVLKELFKAKEKDIEEKYAEDEFKLAEIRKQKQYDLYAAVGQGLGNLSTLFAQGTAASKTAALSEIAINTGLGYLQGLDIAQKGAKATGPAAPFAFPIFYATQVAAILGAVSKARSVLSTVKGGGGSVPTISSPLNSAAPISPRIPQTQTTNISSESINAIGNSAIRAYVVETDITSNQKRVQAIKQRARFS